jgi:glycosyltransferase involved in cell wall biosynthesis
MALSDCRDSLPSRRLIRVLHLVSSGGLYGAEQVILNLAGDKNTASYIGALHNIHGPNLDIIDVAKEKEIRGVVFKSRGRIDVRTIKEIRRFLQDNEIEILHTHGYKSDIVGFFAVLSGKTKWVATNHVWHPISGKLRLYETIDAIVLRFAKRVVAVSDEIRGDLISVNVPPQNIRVIYNGIDTARFGRLNSVAALKSTLGVRLQDFVITMVGRLSPEKGHRLFLEAASRIASCKHDVSFLIVGDGPMKDELRREARRLNLDGRVIFTGFRKDIPAIYALSDLIVNMSSIEGLPITVLEAMASGVPVIAARTGGIPTVIKDNETGLLIESHDVGALTRAIGTLIDDRQKRERLVAAAYEVVTKNHSFDRMCRSYREAYWEILDNL